MYDYNFMITSYCFRDTSISGIAVRVLSDSDHDSLSAVHVQRSAGHLRREQRAVRVTREHHDDVMQWLL